MWGGGVGKLGEISVVQVAGARKNKEEVRENEGRRSTSSYDGKSLGN